MLIIHATKPAANITGIFQRYEEDGKVVSTDTNCWYIFWNSYL